MIVVLEMDDTCRYQDIEMILSVAKRDTSQVRYADEGYFEDIEDILQDGRISKGLLMKYLNKMVEDNDQIYLLEKEGRWEEFNKDSKE